MDVQTRAAEPRKRRPVRALSRQREIGIWAALGASRARLLRQHMTENLTLAMLGGVTGVLIARFSLPLLLALSPQSVPRLVETALDVRVLLFAAAASIATGVLFGCAPALRFAAGDLVPLLKEGNRSSTGTSRNRLQQGLIVGEVALALVLSVSAVLLLKSVVRLQAIDPGFRAERVALGWILLPQTKYSDGAKQTAFFEALLARLEASPEVETAAAVSSIPLGGSRLATAVRTPGQAENAPRESMLVRFATVGYFETMQISLRRGRRFEPGDRAGAPPVALVSDLAARRLWPGDDPIGKRLALGVGGDWREVVGMVASTKHRSMSSDFEPEVYLPFAQMPASAAFVTVRTVASLEPIRAGELIRRATAEIDPNQPVFLSATMEQFIDDSNAQFRFNMLVLGLFGTVGVVLAALGLYSLIAHSVSQREHELAVRLAIGATPLDVMRLVAGQGLRLTVIGVIIGLVGALGLTRFLASILYAVKPTDPVVLASVPIGLLGIALLASYFPARAVHRLDPITKLRGE